MMDLSLGRVQVCSVSEIDTQQIKLNEKTGTLIQKKKKKE